MGSGKLATQRTLPGVRAWAIFGAALLAGLGLTTLVLVGDIESFELNLIEAVQESPLPGNSVSNLLREATTTQLDIAVVGIPLVVVLWFSGYRWHGLALIVLLIVLPIVQHELKEAVDRDRPPFDPDDVWTLPNSRSFPSGHAMSATVVYGWLLYCAATLPWTPLWRGMAIGISVTVLTLVPLASVYLALHWPSDVVGGYAWGLTLLLPAMWIAARGYKPGASNRR